jgi:predicted permease
MVPNNALESLLQDVRYALRSMRRSPGFTLMATASLALGIGANTAIFSLMNAVMLRLLPVQEPRQLVELVQTYPGEPRGIASWTPASYQNFRDHNTVFSALIGTSLDHRASVQIGQREKQIVVAESVTGNYFPVLGITPALGRYITPADDFSKVAVLSYAFWTTQFDQEPTVVGRKIMVGDEPATIIGVAAHDFSGLRLDTATDIWFPRKSSDSIATLLGRLKPAITLEQARAEMPLLYRFSIEERAAKSKDALIRQMTIDVERVGSGLVTVRDRLSKPLSALMVVVGLLLIITCVNIAGLLLARGANREREMAIRLGLGASRSRLVVQALTESFTLAVLGTIAGALLAFFATTALLAVLASGRLHEQVHLRVEPDLHVFAFAAAMALITTLLFGLAPALQLVRAAPSTTLRVSGAAHDTRAKRRFGKALVAVQVAFSLLLLSTGALFLSHLWNLEHKDLGFRRDHVLLVTLDSQNSKETPAKRASDYQQILAGLKHIPGVVNASLCAPTPLSGAGASGFAAVEGFAERPSDRRYIGISWIAPQYFATLGSPLLAGRDFAPQDQQHPRVAIINQTMAHQYLANADPIGKRVTLSHVTMDPDAKTYEIIGVVADSHYSEIAEPAQSSIYLPAFHDGVVTGENFALRTSVNPENVISSVRIIVQRNGNIPIFRTITLTDQIDSSIVLERLIATLSGFFAALGALLVGIGIYGLLAYTVARRTKEIGLRMALGATAARISRMIIFDSAGIVFVGFLIGVPMAAYSKAFAVAIIPGLTVPSFLPLACAMAVILFGAILAAYLPAHRAAHVEPMEALRQD